MYGIYANIGDTVMVNVTIYSIHGSYGIYIYIYIYLVGGIPTPLKNMKVSWGYSSQSIYGKIKFMFQTTNQIYIWDNFLGTSRNI